jgi:hypothetical protein
MPGYEFWTNGKQTGQLMINLIWVVWIMNQLLMLVVLLNFLIAIISQSYEESMSKELINRYKLRAGMNSECRLVLKTFNMLADRGFFILSANDQIGRDKNTWQGFIQTLKTFIRI